MPESASFSRFFSVPVLRVLAVTAVALLVCWGAWKLPLSYQVEDIVSVERAPEQVPLIPGQTLRQTFRTSGGTFSGVVLSSYSQTVDGRVIVARVVDAAGKELSRSTDVRTSYLPADDTLRLEFVMPWFSTQAQEELTEEITLVSGPPLSIRVSQEGVKGVAQSRLHINEQAVSRVAPVAVVRPMPFSTGALQGITTGLVFVVAISLVFAFVPERWRWYVVAALFVAITPLALGGFWFSDNALGIADWDYYFSLHYYYRHALVDFHQLPLWNPWTCGGTAGLGDPEFPMFTLTFLSEYLFGIEHGVRIAIYISIATTALGMLALSRRLRLSLPAAIVATLAGAFGSVSILEIVEGHVNVFAAMWIPWVFFSYLMAYEKNKNSRAAWWFIQPWEIICAVFLALTFYAGGIYLLMYTCLTFLLLPLFVSHRFVAIQTVLRAGLLALGLASFKLFPVLAWLDQFPDQAYAASTVTWPYLIEILLGRYLHGSYILFRQDSGWHEYGAYIGPFALLLSLVALSRLNVSKIVRVLFAGGVIALLLSSVGLSIKPLFDILWFFPRSNISRIILFAIIPLALLAGIGLDVIRQKLKKAWWIVPLMIGLVAVDLMSLDYQLSQQSFVLPHVYPPVSPAPSPIAFTPKRFDSSGQGSRHTRSYEAAIKGYGTMTYCSVLGPGQVAVRTIYDEGGSGAVTISEADATLDILSWTPNRVKVHVVSSTPAELILNTNYAQGWLVNGKPAREIQNRVGVQGVTGDVVLVFEYKPPGFWPGLLISLGTLTALVLRYVFLKDKKAAK